MMAAWKKLGLKEPICLVNKANAKLLQKVIDPGANFDKLLEVQQQAFVDLAKEGVKAMDLAGALFNNKDDKKGQGDIHVDYFKQHLGKNHPHFPQTNNTRFGSHEDIPYSKNNPTQTNIEVNLDPALNNMATVTELCAMTLYTNVISQPYLCVVRGEGVNALDLGLLHSEVKSHIQKILDDPDLLFREDILHEMASLDRKEWEDKDAMKAVQELAPNLPHLQDISLTFFRGSLATWTHFSSEFAPGGLIDEATPAEKWLAWMPATNDVNKGILGYYRVTMHGKPMLTLHQFNAQAMYQWNDTLSLHKQSREVNSSGLEAKHREAQVTFCCCVAEMNMKKAEDKQHRAVELQEKLKNILMILDISEIDAKPWADIDKKGSGRWTAHLYNLQLDALCFWSVPLPKKKDLTCIPQKQDALIAGFGLYLERLEELGVQRSRATIRMSLDGLVSTAKGKDVWNHDDNGDLWSETGALPLE
ncbi:hypothetical protein BT96DRAFT_949484 [Gymnopus androsaceus JB14]|uniref:Uncharacterized protein n=1 Tax=Gymnopus androsaceus JB14 TaxID=1447944 RepID=A0A6A4GK77_9AGAR|nr:hypothetical protein BT96DRAFT_949484 [Gymnopus androsaceus JB14]